MAPAYSSGANGDTLENKFGNAIQQVTIRQLLSMRGNIEDYDEIEFQRQNPTHDIGPVETVQMYGQGRMRYDRPLGSCGVYSSMGYVLLGLVLNGQDGTSW